MRTALVGLLLLLAGTARADMSVPWEKSLETVAVVRLDHGLGGKQVFVVCGNLVQPLHMLDPQTGRVEPFGGYYRDRPVKLCAVGAVELPHDPKGPTAEWLAARNGVLWSSELRVRRDLVSVTDPRQTITLQYRLEHTPTELKLELVSEHVEKKWSGVLTTGVGCLLSILAVASLFGWLAVKAVRRKPVTRTAPPPGR